VAASAEFGEAVGSQGASEENDLPAGAAFHRAVGDPDGRARDLHKVQGVAEPGSMRLFLCDCALKRARAALAYFRASFSKFSDRSASFAWFAFENWNARFGRTPGLPWQPL